MTLKIISTSKIVYEGQVNSVTLPGTQGLFTVLKNHASLISTLNAGIISYKDDNGTQGQFDVRGGIVDVDNNVISVCIY
ncbi:MAG: ATP synthase F1 subunit epsilon [Muribaculaceae bacterium]|nr:ATP synthase F1 subunit epsilon [Muribaculaceae bacterium]